MKKSLFSIFVALLVVFLLAGCNMLSSTEGDTATKQQETTTKQGGETTTKQGGETTTNQGGETTTKITAGPNAANIGSIVVWCAENAVDLTERQLDAFLAANAESVTFTYSVNAVGEGDAATQMITDVEAGADIFCFAQDQLARLVEAGALAKLSDTTVAKVTAANDGGAVKAASINDTLYAYPMTSDNGYFMYYDKSVVDEEHLDDLAAIIADVEEAGRTFNFELTSAWYNASFFFAVGCSSVWSTNEKGAYTSAVDNYNSANGLIALKGMQILTSSSAYVAGSQASAFNAAEGVKAAVVISGTWDVNAAQEALGNDFAATDLPSFTVDGTTYHLGSFSGNKLMGVKPQTNATRAAVLAAVANYLTGEECQLQRFNELGWGPSNLADQATDAVKENVALYALAQQNRYAFPQGQYPNAWWDIAGALGTVALNAETEADLQEGLTTYVNAVQEIIELQSQEEKDYVLVGEWNGWNNKGEDADGNATEFKLVKQENGTYSTTVYLEEGQFGRITVYGDWTNDAGYAQTDTELVTDYGNDNNFTVAESGMYVITFMPTTKAITIEHPTYVLVGQWNGWNNADAAYAMTFDAEEKVYTFELTAAANDNGRIVPSGSWMNAYGYLLVDAENTLVADDNGGDHNFKFAEAGTYAITFDPIAKVITIAASAE